MCHGRRGIFGTAVAGLLILSLTGIDSWGGEPYEEPIGSITALEGKVYLYYTGGTLQEVRAMLGGAIHLGDHIQTEKQSRVQILLRDESLLNLAENTHIQITEHIYSPDENRRSVVIRVLMGTVRGFVGRRCTGPGSRYVISIPTDTIAVGHGCFVVDAVAGRIQ